MPEDPTALVPATPPLPDNDPSSTVRQELVESAKRNGINRPTLLSQIGHGVTMSPQQKKSLMRLATDEMVSLLPTGEVYVEGVYWRRALNETFGPLQWGILSVSEPVLELAPPDSKAKSMLFLEVFVIVKGTCIGSAIGAQEYFPGSKRMTKDDALEGCRTNGLMRVMKQFGTYSNLWESKWANPCRERIGIKVRVKEGWPAQQWRRIDTKPLPNEVGLAPDSPNREHFKEPEQPARAERPARPAEPPAQKPNEPDALTLAKRSHDKIDHVTEETEPGKILVIRPVTFMNTSKQPPEPDKYWVVNTEHDEFITNDELMVRALEAIRVRAGKIVIVSHDMVTSSRGTRKRLVEYRAVEK